MQVIKKSNIITSQIEAVESSDQSKNDLTTTISNLDRNHALSYSKNPQEHLKKRFSGVPTKYVKDVTTMNKNFM